MAKVVKFLKTIRNNWKKSLAGFSVLTYGVYYAKAKYEDSVLMRQRCEEAIIFGDVTLPVGQKPRKITVFLNPAANRRKAKKNFEEYCSPLLNLAGLSVNVISTEHEGQVRTFLETFDEDTDAIIIAGGDGTLSEAITGVLRKSDGGNIYPVGILPLGRTNTVANSLFSSNVTDKGSIFLMTKATMAIIRNVTKPIDVMKIEVMEEENEVPGKPVYSLSGVQWGAYRDAFARRDKYWYFNELRSYVTYIFTGLKGDAAISWKCDADLNYTLPCSGCSRCYKTLNYDLIPKSGSRWWHMFRPRTSVAPSKGQTVDCSKILNEECGQLHHESISTVELSVTTTNIYSHCPHNKKPHVEISIGPPTIGFMAFVAEGWRRLKGYEPRVDRKLLAAEVELRPLLGASNEGKEHWMSIDLEDYEVKPVHLALLPKRIHMFCVPENLVEKSVHELHNLSFIISDGGEWADGTQRGVLNGEERDGEKGMSG